MSGNSVQAFIDRWSSASASERANSQLFLAELCDALGVPRPDPTFQNGYAFEFPVPQHQRDGSVTEGRIDLYKRGCFVLESKQFHAQQAPPSSLETALHDAQQELPAGEFSSSAPVSYRQRRGGPTRGTERWDDAMFKARGQAERYIRSLPQHEPTPPFLIVVDVGDTFEVYADFTQAGKAYLPFPDPRGFRLKLADLAREEIRERLKLIWTTPLELDPSRKSAAVTREIAGHLAELAKSLEAAGHPAQAVAEFLTRCLFCMFAEDVGLLPKDSFRDLLKSVPDDGSGFEDLLRQLFREMNTGTGKGISVVLRKKLLQFNGGLFADDTVLPVNRAQLFLLRLAATLDWKSVEPAIFGTLLERALNPHERHKLGAHYTPRAYVERLVLPTVVEPIRAEWEAVRAAALTHARADRLKEARQEILAFHKKLCEVRVLDPACGSGNFLYVTLEHLKRLEGEVLDVAATFGENLLLELTTHTVDPHQFLGIEVNPRAAAITELVLWIGYLQWHFRTRGQTMPAEPVLKRFRNIECRDAVLAWDGEPEPVTWQMVYENPDIPGLPEDVRRQGRASLSSARRGEAQESSTRLSDSMRGAVGTPRPTDLVTVWDRRSFKTDMVTGREVPDETKRVPLLTYKNPRPAEWPKTDYVVGNPPYIGVRKLKAAIGDGYVDTLRTAYPEVPETSDYVLYWWDKAAKSVEAGDVQHFGFITTNSIVQSYSRRLLEHHLSSTQGLRIIYAIPDHPWVDASDGAAVRVALTVGGRRQSGPALLGKVVGDGESACVVFTKVDSISAELEPQKKGAAKILPLKANSEMCFQGVVPAGDGFKLESSDLSHLGVPEKRLPSVIRRYIIGKDLVQVPEKRYIIDLFGCSESNTRAEYPKLYQWLLDRVKPERIHNSRASYRDKWWIFAEPRPAMRRGLAGLSRFIVTPYTAKFRPFVFVDGDCLPDAMAYAIASEDALVLGILSSRVHGTWALAAGGTLEDRPRYNSKETFFPFPFPDCSAAQKEKIRALAEELDAHRKKVQAQHPGLTLTGMYNVLEKLRAADGARLCAQHQSQQPETKQPMGDSLGSDSIRVAAAGSLNTAALQLTPKEKQIHDTGLVSVLKQLHDDLDAAVFEAYGWPKTLTDAEILERVVALNAERAREEAEGKIRWLRPEYQNPGGTSSTSPTLNLPTEDTRQKKSGTRAARPSKAAKVAKQPWPKSLAERVKAVSEVIRRAETQVTTEEVAKAFKRADAKDVGEILETLCVMGQAHRGKAKGTYLP